MIGNPCFHRWCHAKRLMNPPEVIIHIVQCHRVRMILSFLAEGICEPRKPAHAHADGEVLAFDVARGDVFKLGVPLNALTPDTYALRGTIAGFSLRRRTIEFNTSMA
jgi:hypothetical protein